MEFSRFFSIFRWGRKVIRNLFQFKLSRYRKNFSWTFLKYIFSCLLNNEKATCSPHQECSEFLQTFASNVVNYFFFVKMKCLKCTKKREWEEFSEMLVPICGNEMWRFMGSVFTWLYMTFSQVFLWSSTCSNFFLLIDTYWKCACSCKPPLWSPSYSTFHTL